MMHGLAHKELVRMVGTLLNMKIDNISRDRANHLCDLDVNVSQSHYALEPTVSSLLEEQLTKGVQASRRLLIGRRRLCIEVKTGTALFAATRPLMICCANCYAGG